MLDLIFVHVGKTGGSSVITALRDHYGAEHSFRDRSPEFEVPEAREHRRGSAAKRLSALAATRFVHGHVRLSDYDGVPARLRITFLRDPISRVLSHYSYWLEHASSAPDEERRRLRDERWSLLEFAARPRIRHLYTEHFFGGADMRAFDLIGCFERLPEDFQKMAKLVGMTAELPHRRPNPDPDYAARKRNLAENPTLQAELRRLLSEEYEFYRLWTA